MMVVVLAALSVLVRLIFHIKFSFINFIDFGVAQHFKRGCRDIQFPIECGKTIVRLYNSYLSIDFLSGFRNLSVFWRSL